MAFIVNLVVLFAVFQVGWSLNCWHCTSLEDSTCADAHPNAQSLDCNSATSENFNKKFNNILSPEIVTNVPGMARNCHKLVMENGVVVRTCLDAHHGPHCCHHLKDSTQANTPDRKIKECEMCDKDNCN